MSALRIALHQCAEILADALEAEEAAKAAPKPKKRRSPTYNPPPPSPVSEAARLRARSLIMRLGLPLKSVG